MLEREFGASFLNLVCNHPSVFPWVSTKGLDYIDATDLVLNRENVLLTNEYAAFMLAHLGDGVYELHSQILPPGRIKTQEHVADMLEYMFTCTPCESIKTYIPDSNKAAIRAARLAGFKYVCTEGEWEFYDDTVDELQHYIMTKQEWQECQSQV